MNLSTEQADGKQRLPMRCLRVQTLEPVRLLPGKTLYDVLQALEEFLLYGDIEVHPLYDPDPVVEEVVRSVPMSRPTDKLALTPEGQLTFVLDYAGDRLVDPPATFSTALAPLLAEPTTLLWRDVDEPPEHDQDALCEWRVSLGVPPPGAPAR